MSNPIRISFGSPRDNCCLFSKNNFEIAVDPSVPCESFSHDDFYQGVSPVEGGYVVYEERACMGPEICSIQNDGALISYVKDRCCTSFTGVSDALYFMLTETESSICVNLDYPEISTDGLAALYDFGYTLCSAQGRLSEGLNSDGSTISAQDRIFDVSRYRSNARIMGNPADDAFRVEGLNRERSYFNCSGDAYFEVEGRSQNEFTICFWVKGTDNHGPLCFAYCGEYDVSIWQNPIKDKPTEGAFRVFFGAGETAAISGKTADLGSDWHFVAMSLSGSVEETSIGLYIDGIDMGSVQVPGFNPNSDSVNFFVGCQYLMQKYYYGNIGAFIYYEKSLPLSETEKTYLSMKGKYGIA